VAYRKRHPSRSGAPEHHWPHSALGHVLGPFHAFRLKL